jgi:hypothetical protein
VTGETRIPDDDPPDLPIQAKTPEASSGDYMRIRVYTYDCSGNLMDESTSTEPNAVPYTYYEWDGPTESKTTPPVSGSAFPLHPALPPQSQGEGVAPLTILGGEPDAQASGAIPLRARRAPQSEGRVGEFV